jgi:hypothetical protein
LSAFLLLGGPSVAAAIADPGGEHSDRGGRSESDDGSGGERDGFGDRDSGNGTSRRGSGDSDLDVSDQGSFESPKVRIGSGRTDTQQLMPDDSSSARSGSDSNAGSGSGGGSDLNGGPGSARSDARNSGFNPPRVTVGNGRTPGILSGDDSEPRWRTPVAEPAPPPPPPPPPVAPVEPSWVDRIATPPALPKQLAVAPAADWTDPLWGIAGLLLIPAAGAALGYRQARASHAAERLGRT